VEERGEVLDLPAARAELELSAAVNRNVCLGAVVVRVEEALDAPESRRLEVERARREGKADDVDDVAPACVVLAECDPLVDEGIPYADKLRAAGVAVELDLVRGVTHDFIKMGRVLPEAATAQAFIAHHIAEAFSA